MIDKAKELWASIKTNGCSSSPDLFYRKCCDKHDRQYELGTREDGTPITRSESDAELRGCMMESGKTPIIGKFILPIFYWSVVRVFGGSHWKK